MVDDHLASRDVAAVADGWGEAPLGRRLLAEFVGTLLFVAVGTGAATVLAGIAPRALGSLPPEVRQAPGQEQIFGALLATGPADLLTVAFAFALALAVLVYALGGVSGAHFNPAVTFALAVSRRFGWREVPLYWVVQCLGAIAGTFVIAGIYGETGAEVGETDLLFGAPVVAAGITTYQAILAEAFIAFVLMTAIMAVAIDPRAPKGWSGLIIGLALAAGIVVTAAATGGSANFARTLGPYVTSGVYDWIGNVSLNIPWSDLLVYAAGPVIGASAAALVYESVTGLERLSPAPAPGAATGEHRDQPLEGAFSGPDLAGDTVGEPPTILPDDATRERPPPTAGP